MAGPVAAFGAALLLQLPLLDRGIVLEDEGATITFAARMAQGEVLYRDLPINLAPGAYELFALLFRMLRGPSYLAARALVSLAAATCAAALYVAARRAGAGPASWMAPLAFLALRPFAFPSWHIAFYSPFGIAAAVAAVALLLPQGDREPPGTAITAVAGALGGLSAAFKQNYGALALLAAAAILVLGCAPARRWLALLGGFSAPLAAVAAVYAVRGALPDLVRCTVIFVLSKQGETFHVPSPPIAPLLGPDTAFRERFLYYVPPLVWETFYPELARTTVWRSTGLVELVLKSGFYAPWVPAALLALRPAGPSPVAARGLGIAALLFLALGSYPTQDWAHFTFSVPLAFAALAAAVAPYPRLRRAVAAALVAGAAATAAFMAVAMERYDYPLPTVGLRVPEGLGRPLEEARSHLERKGDRSILVMPYQPGFQQVSRCGNPSRVVIFLPAFVPQAELARVEALVDAGVPVVLFRKEYAHLEPFTEAFPTLARRLAGRPEATFQGDGFRIEIHRRRPARAATPPHP